MTRAAVNLAFSKSSKTSTSVETTETTKTTTHAEKKKIYCYYAPTSQPSY